MKYVGKVETPFNVRLNNHGNTIHSPKGIPTCQHFGKHWHDFIKHEKFGVTEQLKNILNQVETY